jgi:hypothetical protein
MAARPCTNLTFENITITGRNGQTWGCVNVSSITVRNVFPPGLQEACGL